jgi:hypothetical protein
MSNQAGKGDKYRKVDKDVYDKNYDNVDWERQKKAKKNKKHIAEQFEFDFAEKP